MTGVAAMGLLAPAVRPGTGNSDMEGENVKTIHAILVMFCVGLFALGAGSTNSYAGWDAAGGNYTPIKIKSCGPWNGFCGGLGMCGPWNNFCGGGGGGGDCGPWNNFCHGGGKKKCGKWNDWCGQADNDGDGDGKKCGKWNNWCKDGGGMQGDAGGKPGKKGQVSQASCAKLGLTYIGGAGNTCYCPGQYVNKGTGLPAASSSKQCVTPESYNQLKGL
jgi:hypothetical protein